MIGLELRSPIVKIDLPDFKQENVELYVKRDDLIHPFISGNKWRKLKFLLEDAKKQQKTTIATFGGAWSNHLLATACAGANFGFKTIGFVRGEEKVQNPVLSLCKVFGMELIFVDRESYRNKNTCFETRLGAKAANSYFIDEGGYSREALRGCAEILEELDREYEHIFCACGTGTTLAGLAQGIDELGYSTQLHGIPVLKGGDFIKENVIELYSDAQFELHCDFHFGGYAKTKPELNQFIRHFCATTGILIEPVYTGKMFYAIFELLKNKSFNSGDKILALHTGGLTGILGFQDHF